jgi:predicted DNA-binding protein
MKRIRIQITDQQASRLRELSAERRQPVAALIRASIDSFLAVNAASRFASGLTDVSSKHDQYLAEALRGHDSEEVGRRPSR